MQPVRTAVVGVGYLGRFHAEKFATLPGAELVAVVDTDEGRASDVAVQFGARALADYREILGEVDAVSIVVPTALHFKVAREFLNRGVHVLVEKPMTVSVEEARALIDIADKQELVLQVGHLERFNSAMLALKDTLREPRFIESHRLAPFKDRGADVNVVLDLMIHDIDIIQNMVRSPIASIDANGVSVLTAEPDIANAHIRFESGCVANVTASRVSLKSERKIRLFQHDAYISIDLMNRNLRVHRTSDSGDSHGMDRITVEETSYESGDALKMEIEAFLDSVAHRRPPAVSGEDGLKALETAIAITRMVESNA
ncbi:MAG: Gfo/Idh/MocA family oxidoreductase [Gammaproteobacteria bacterium]